MAKRATKPPAILRPDEYYICIGGSDGERFYRIDAEPITIPGFEDADLFVHPRVDADGTVFKSEWRVTEGRTGMMVASAGTKDDALAAAEKRLTKAGNQSFNATLTARLRTRAGRRTPLVNPRYQPKE